MDYYKKKLLKKCIEEDKMTVKQYMKITSACKGTQDVFDKYGYVSPYTVEQVLEMGNFEGNKSYDKLLNYINEIN